MSDSEEDQKDPDEMLKTLMKRSGEPLNDFSHREDKPNSEIISPEDLVTQATPAQKERVVYLVDSALDTMERLLHFSKPEVQLKAAENVLDRAGLAKVSKVDNAVSGIDIPANVLVDVIGGLAKMFNVREPDMRTVNEERVLRPAAKVLSDDAQQGKVRSKAKANTSTSKKKNSVPQSVLDRASK